MKRSTFLVGAASLAVLLAACGGETTTAPVTPTSALTPGKPKFDDIPNTLDATIDATAEVMALTAGGADGTTTLYVQPRNGDGVNGCNVKNDAAITLSVTSNNTAAATVSPSSVTLSDCGEPNGRTLTIHPVAQGTATVSVSLTVNNTSGTFNLAPATFTVNVAPPANTAPTVAVAGVGNGASYPKGSVPAATCQVTDAEDGPKTFAATLSAITGPNAVDRIGSQTASCSYTDAGSLTASASATYSIVDAAAPAISYVLNPTAPDGLNGWYRGNALLTWTVTGTSVMKSGCVDQSVSADQAATTYACTATNSKGTTGPVNVTIKRDGTAPTVAYESAAPTPNAAGWYNVDVAATFKATDNLSGFGDPVSLTRTGMKTTSGEGTSVTVGSPSFVDNAGNTVAAGAATSAAFKIDKTLPTISGAATTSPNGAGWYNSNVTVHYSCDDALSGIAICSADDVLSTDGTNNSASGSATDKADNTASTTVSGIKIDKTAPTIMGNRSPAANANGWNNTDVSVTFTCDDALSGVNTCGPDATVSAEGANQTVPGNVSDKAGNTASTSVANISIDKTAPSISGSDVNNTTWRNTDLSQGFTASDALSGLVSSADASFTLTASAQSLNASTPTTVTKTVFDKAGNSTTRTLSALIDKTAPVVGSVSFSDPDIPVSGNTTLNASFTESLSGVSSSGATYTLNGGSPRSMVVTGSSASASVSGLSAGLYNVCVQVTDVAGNTSGATVETCAYLAVYDPNGGFVTGGGWINSPEGACKNWSGCTDATVGKANFGFVSKYLPGRTTAPEGSTEFQFQAGNLKFKSTSYETLIVAGDRAQFWGTGTVNGGGSFAFRLTAIDGTPDKFRMEIWNGPRDTGTKIYDNQWGAAQDAALTTAIGGGSIQIKR